MNRIKMDLIGVRFCIGFHGLNFFGKKRLPWWAACGCGVREIRVVLIYVLCIINYFLLKETNLLLLREILTVVLCDVVV